MDWLSIPMTVIVGLVAYNFKKTLARIEALELEVIKIQLQVARNEVNVQNLTQQINQISVKLDRILDRLVR